MSLLEQLPKIGFGYFTAAERGAYSGGLVSIARGMPEGLQNLITRKSEILAPSWELFRRYKASGRNWEQYVSGYYGELGKRFAKPGMWPGYTGHVVESLRTKGPMTLLCWEGAWDYCHRRLVYNLFDKIGLPVVLPMRREIGRATMIAPEVRSNLVEAAGGLERVDKTVSPRMRPHAAFEKSMRYDPTERYGVQVMYPHEVGVLEELLKQVRSQFGAIGEQLPISDEFIAHASKGYKNLASNYGLDRL